MTMITDPSITAISIELSASRRRIRPPPHSLARAFRATTETKCTLVMILHPRPRDGRAARDVMDIISRFAAARRPSSPTLATRRVPSLSEPSDHLGISATISFSTVGAAALVSYGSVSSSSMRGGRTDLNARGFPLWKGT